MPSEEFQQRQEEVQEGRGQLEAQQLSLFLAEEKLKRLAASQATLARLFDPENEADVRRQRQLEAQQAETKQQIAALREEVRRAGSMLEERLRAFLPMTDPRRAVEELNDLFPVLLLPLRLETRFKRLFDPDGTRHELWVRVYPDDCAIDTFEPVLSVTEVRNGQKYWAHVWRAGDDEAELRAAWRNLVASHGSGRSMWIVQNYRPLNEGEQPARPDQGLILVIPAETALPAAERPAVESFWQARWRAGDDGPAAAAAYEALVSALGDARAQEIVDLYRPFNLADPPPAGLSRAESAVIVAIVRFTSAEETEAKRRAWSRAPRVSVLPDRLVLLGYAGGQLVMEEVGQPIPSPLIVGPDPLAAENEQIRQVDEEIVPSEEMRWMVDFDEAVRQGMAFRVSLSAAAYRRGLDRLLVLGVRLSSSEADGQRRFEELLHNHLYSRGGLSLLTQGMATNNTEEKGAAYSSRDDADRSFELMNRGGASFDPAADWFDRPDGQWLATWLGIDPALLQNVANADRHDVGEALAMNAALWPATIGYFMDTMMAPVFNDRTIEFTRRFFTRLVSGRGLSPGLRIGRQPYGILPATVYRRLQWPRRDDWGPGLAALPAGGAAPFLDKLHEILMRAYDGWGELVERVSHVGKAGDPHQLLLDILGLEATSVEYYTRYAQSLEQVINSLNLQGFGGLVQKILIAAGLQVQGTEILRDHGYDVAARERPELLDKYFLQTPTRLTGDLIDDQPLSETEPIRAYTPDGRNYIAWLADAARLSLETIRGQQGFTDDRAPGALLYLMLRHALLLGYYDTGVRLYTRAGVLDEIQQRDVYKEASFVHIAEQEKFNESRWQLLYQAQPEVTDGQPNLLVADYIPQILGDADEAARLREQIAALDRLKELPTARLERIFAEHLDSCSYRLDAWLQGLVHHQLVRMRDVDGGQEGTRQGLYLGAYGWLEELRPDEGRLEPVELTDEALRAIFQQENASPLMRDSTNAGYVHTPSLNHAVTAGVLRNGYLSNAAPGEPDRFSVNLSSERVRRAMAIIEGMHGGQSLGALLGYQFERGLHDRHAQAEVDAFIFKLRKAFPLRADRLAETSTDESVSIEAIEARNVLDGVALVEHIQRSGEENYPFGIAWLPPASSAQAAAINAEVRRLQDSHDAVADLGIAEGVHQVVQGNYDRAAASLDAFSRGELPPLPEVVQSPRSGTGLTHRVALHLVPGLEATASPHPGLPVTPRAAAEPALNHWLAGLLPPPGQVGVIVRLQDDTGLDSEQIVTQADLALQPLDLIFMVNPLSEQAMSALDDRIAHHLRGSLRPDGEITIAYTERVPGLVSFFELGALLNHLRSLLLAGRPLQATDLALPNEAGGEALPLPIYHTDRLVHIRDRLEPPLDALRALVVELEPLLDDVAANEADLIDNIDDRLQRLSDALAALSLYGLPQTGYGFALAWKRHRYAALLQKVAALVERWQGQLDRFDALMTEYSSLPAGTTDEERFARLQEIEAQVSMALTDPLPPTPADYEAVVNDRRTSFVTKRAAFNTILGTTTSSLATLFRAIEAESSDLDQFDYVRLNLEEEVAEMVRFSQDLLAGARSLVASVEGRIATVNDGLAAHAAATTANDRQTTVQQAAAALLGEDFRLIPEFALTIAQAAELQKGYDERDRLLDYLQTTAQVDFPVDDWLYGVARVREPMGHWEAATMLAEALTGTELALQPLQLPFQEESSWLALPYPPGTVLEQDHLLYTAHYATPFVGTAVQCGLLLDEWTEVIPAREETTGIAFHYDRPSAEPPQVMLLVTPPQINGRWEWADLVDTLHETLELARRRAVEPDQIAATNYARFLPATISAVTMQPITIALNLALNNQVYHRFEGENDG